MTFPILWINHTTYAVILYYKENVKIRYILDLRSPLISPKIWEIPNSIKNMNSLREFKKQSQNMAL